MNLAFFLQHTQEDVGAHQKDRPAPFQTFEPTSSRSRMHPHTLYTIHNGLTVRLITTTTKTVTVKQAIIAFWWSPVRARKRKSGKFRKTSLIRHLCVPSSGLGFDCCYNVRTSCRSWCGPDPTRCFGSIKQNMCEITRRDSQ